MAFAPTKKNPGDLVKSADWNDAMSEVVRLDGAKLNLTGGAVTGPLTVAGALGVGTTTPDRAVTVQGPAGTYLNVKGNSGAFEVLLGADAGGGIVSTMTNHDLQLRSGANKTRLTIKADGKVGIGTGAPAFLLDVADRVRFQQGPSGSAGAWLFQANANRGFMGMLDDNSLGLWGAVAGWGLLMNVNNGFIGIGISNPGFRVDVADRVRLRQGVAPSAGMWFHQSAPNNDRAFVGMANDNQVGFWGNTGAGWGLQMDTTNGNVVIRGSLSAGGGKGGYVVDNFLNAVGETIEQGDVVVLGESEISLFYGVDDNIPIPEVDLTARAYDTRACGIVDSVVQQDHLPPVIKSAQKDAQPGEDDGPHPMAGLAASSGADIDATKVGRSQLGKMVTLGAYAHCKVDADIAPIRVGDLLTTSPTKGHAQKVLEPAKAIGAILGKALGSLDKGKGKIPVIVLLQ